ncbi:MAG: bifunctional phosphoglucose/phosphomannose isomerase [Actinomycetota bacterium]
MTFSPSGLDEPATIESVDRSGMLAVVEQWASQWQDAVALCSNLPDVRAAFDHVLVCGMGGSGIAGDVARAMVEPTSKISIHLVRGHSLPAYAGANTLVVCVSYSGNTAETLSCYDDARLRGCTVAVITSGGVLAQRARGDGAWMLDALPAGLMPRAALALLVVPMLTLFERAGICQTSSLIDEGLAASAACVDRWRRDVPESQNTAKRIALAIGNRIPIVWGTEGAQQVAATRWKNQLSENAKLPSISAMLPELCHNDIVGLYHGHDAMREAILIVLRAEREQPRDEQRLNAAVEIARQGLGALEVVSCASLIEALVLGDFVSVYTAIARGVDPTPIEAIRLLKDSVA